MCNESSVKSLNRTLARQVLQASLRVIELKIAIKNRSGKCGGGNERERSRYDEDNGEETTSTISVETERPG